MSVNNRKSRAGRIITLVGCGLLLVISLITFQQQIPTVSQTTKIYDKEYINALRHIKDVIPQNETLTTPENYPQVTYFTDHKVKVPSANSERSLVEFMWRTNSSYLLVPEDTSVPKADNTPLLIQLAEKPFEKISDFYAEYISVPKADNSPLLNTSVPKADNTSLNTIYDAWKLRDIHKSIEGDIFEKLFEKILDYNTEGSILHLYHLRSNITGDNLSIVTDKTKPMLSVSLPINGTIIESEFEVLRVNITGSAIDVDSNIKNVETSIDGRPFELANPRAPDDWSMWSFSDYIVNQGTKKIMVRATDNADNRIWAPVYITIK
jgi:hypothetical protein